MRNKSFEDIKTTPNEPENCWGFPHICEICEHCLVCFPAWTCCDEPAARTTK